MSDKCLTYKGECLDTTYVYQPEPNDFESPLLRRCAIAIDMGVDKGSVLKICYEAGQSPEHAELTYIAAEQLSKSREV